MPKPFPTRDRVIELLTYCADSGEFRWKTDRRSGAGAGRINARAGDLAGSLTSNKRYLAAGIDNKSCPLHQLVFLIEDGDWPKGEVDHLNGVMTDNRRANLRHVNRQTNAENFRVAMKSNLSTGVLGVTKKKKNGKYEARLTSKGVYYHLGTFYTVDLAASAYLEAKRRIHAGCTL